MAYNLFRQTERADSYWQWDEAEDDPPRPPNPSFVPSPSRLLIDPPVCPCRVPLRLVAPRPPLLTNYWWAIPILMRRHLEGHGPPLPRSIPMPFGLCCYPRTGKGRRKPRPLPERTRRIPDFPYLL